MTEEADRMMITVVEVNIPEDVLRDYRHFPAFMNGDPTYEVYFLKDGKIVGTGSVGSIYNGHVTVYLKKGEVETHYFKDDYAVKLLGHHAPFRFHQITGDYIHTMSDEPGDRCEDVSIVSRWSFDWGFHSKKRYGDIEGFGKVRENAKQTETQLDRDRAKYLAINEQDQMNEFMQQDKAAQLEERDDE